MSICVVSVSGCAGIQWPALLGGIGQRRCSIAVHLCCQSAVCLSESVWVHVPLVQMNIDGHL